MADFDIRPQCQIRPIDVARLLNWILRLVFYIFLPADWADYSIRDLCGNLVHIRMIAVSADNTGYHRSERGSHTDIPCQARSSYPAYPLLEIGLQAVGWGRPTSVREEGGAKP